MLINHDYKVIVIVNGHGAVNQLETVERLSKHYSHTSDCLVVWSLSFPDEVAKDSLAGHADLYENSLMMYYQKLYGLDSVVDLTTLPEKSVPIHYPDFSIVDGEGFSKNPSPGKIVKTDPRNASEEKGEEIYEKIVKKFIKITEDALKEKGLS